MNQSPDSRHPPLEETIAVPNQGVSVSQPTSTPSLISRGLRVRCPHCRNPFDLLADAELVDLLCALCGNRFSLAGEQTIATVAHFELLERLGMGGFGTVWKARDVQLGRIVALKIPRQGQLAPEVVEEFLHEARVAAQLEHPNIVRVYEIGRDGELVYIVSEFMEGKSLSDWVDERPLSPRDAAKLLARVCRALHHAHEDGVIHRDLKPGNILMDDRGEPHITDFGLAKREIGDVTMSLDGTILGTPAYMSPEQAQGKISQTDRRSDVYSIGVMLFKLLTDELPFRGNVQVLIFKAIHEEAPRPTSLNENIPLDLETICLKCLEKEPSRRFPTALAVAEELERFLAGEPILSRPISPVARAWRWCRRNPLVLTLFGSFAAVMLIVYLLAWQWFAAAYRRADERLTKQALSGLRFAADSVAKSATREMEDRFQQIEAAANDDDLQRSMQQMLADPRLPALRSELNDPNLAEARRDELREQLLSRPAQQAVQQAVERLAAESSGLLGWFVIAPDGLQVARSPLNKTVGMNYAWRTYFHGGPSDFADYAAYLQSPRERIEHTHVSAAFVSQISERWVVCVSAPINAAGDTRENLGVIGFLCELGRIATLPGEPSGNEFATLVDSRPGFEGVILQHPLYESLLAKSRERLPDRLQKLRVGLDGWQRSSDGLESSADFRDPLSADGLGREYRGRWLAAKAPVNVRSQPTGLQIVVQRGYDDAVGEALNRLYRQVLYLSGTTLVLVIGLVVPIWAIVLRRVGSGS